MKTYLHLFTVHYPNIGGEVFLQREIESWRDTKLELLVFSQVAGSNKDNRGNGLPNTADFVFYGRPKLKQLMKDHGLLVLKWWISELMYSPHRLKYIVDFKWNYFRFIGLLDTAVRLKNYMNDVNAERNIYYSYWFNEWATVLALARDMGLKGRFITRAHGYDFDEAQQSRGYHPFRFTEIRKLDGIYQVSEYGLNYMRRQFPKANNLFLSRLGTQDHGIGPLGSGDTYQIVSCSNFVPLKRIPLIARTLKELDLKFHWTHFGDGPERGDVEREVLEILPAENVTFKGYVSNPELMEYYRHHPVDLFVNMSILEGIPVSMMEAISFGIPVVGFNICGIPEIINSHTGALLQPESGVNINIMTIRKILLEKSRDIVFRTGIKKYWNQNYDALKNYSEFVSNSLIDRI